MEGLSGNTSLIPYIGTPGGTVAEPVNIDQAFASGGLQYDSGPAWGSYGSIAPAPVAAPVYRDAYGNVRGSQAEADAATNLGRNVDTSEGNYVSATGLKFNNLGTDYDTRNRDFVNNIRTGQEGLNTGRSNTALNLRRGMAAIAGGVRQGLRSGGVSLANMNALDSGAAEAMARAWARQGNGQVADASNEAQLQNNVFDSQQTNLIRQRDEGLNDLTNYRGGQVGTIGEELAQNLRQIDAQAQGGGLTGIVDFSARDRLVNDAVARLNAIDAATRNRLAGVRSLTPEEINARAAQMDQAGVEGSSPFQVDTGGQLTQAGGNVGAPIGQLPIFTRRKSDI